MVEQLATVHAEVRVVHNEKDITSSSSTSSGSTTKLTTTATTTATD